MTGFKTANRLKNIKPSGLRRMFSQAKELINLGDEVFTPDPGFVCYEPSVYMTEGRPVSTPLKEKNGFGIDEEVVISHITEKSRMVIVNSPNNPTGSTFSHDELSKLAKVAEERDLTVISDEVYEKITYDNL